MLRSDTASAGAPPHELREPWTAAVWIELGQLIAIENSKQKEDKPTLAWSIGPIQEQTETK